MLPQVFIWQGGVVHSQRAHVPKVCVIVRTHQKHGRETLEGLILSLLAGVSEDTVNVQIHLLRTEASDDRDYIINSLIHPPIRLSEFVKLFPFRVHLSPVLPLRDEFSLRAHGYVTTDLELQRLQRAGKNGHDACTYYLFTNGDNFYSSHLWGKVAPYMQDRVGLIAYSFACHHEDMRATRVEFAWGHVDLGAVLVSSACLEKTGAVFIPEDVDKVAMDQDSLDRLFAADWFLFENLAAQCEHVELEHVLFLHQ